MVFPDRSSCEGVSTRFLPAPCYHSNSPNERLFIDMGLEQFYARGVYSSSFAVESHIMEVGIRKNPVAKDTGDRVSCYQHRISTVKLLLVSSSGGMTMEFDLHFLFETLVVVLQNFYHFRSGKFRRKLTAFRQCLTDHCSR